MFSFDLSVINILLMAAVVVLFTLFITVLMKLNPSTETRKKPEPEITIERQKPPQTPLIAQRSPPPPKTEVPKLTEKTSISVNPPIRESPIQAKQERPTITRSESREILKPEKPMVQVKTESAPSRKDCLHQFGYLRTLPKNAPIPDECFGCTKIVECLVQSKHDKG